MQRQNAKTFEHHYGKLKRWKLEWNGLFGIKRFSFERCGFIWRSINLASLVQASTTHQKSPRYIRKIISSVLPRPQTRRQISSNTPKMAIHINSPKINTVIHHKQLHTILYNYVHHRIIVQPIEFIWTSTTLISRLIEARDKTTSARTKHTYTARGETRQTPPRVPSMHSGAPARASVRSCERQSSHPSSHAPILGCSFTLEGEYIR